MPIRPHTLPQRPPAPGFTLVELMVTVAVLGILAVIAAPSMITMINNGRIVGQTEEMVALLQLARAEAVRRNTRVSVCGNAACTSTNWAEAVVVHPDGTADDPAVIRSVTAPSGVAVTGPAAGVVFRPSGLISAAQNVNITMSGQQRCVTVAVSGIATVAKGACS